MEVDPPILDPATRRTLRRGRESCSAVRMHCGWIAVDGWVECTPTFQHFTAWVECAMHARNARVEWMMAVWVECVVGMMTAWVKCVGEMMTVRVECAGEMITPWVECVDGEMTVRVECVGGMITLRVK